MSSELPSEYTRIILHQRPPAGPITPETFELQRRPIQELQSALKDDSVLVRIDFLSLDPAMRGWLNDRRSYVPPVQIGEVMRAMGLGTVLAVGKDVQKVKVGDTVTGLLGWTEYTVLPEKHVSPISVPDGAIPLDFLGLLGMTGLTAYFGLFDVAQLKPGETLVVSGAAGATGSVACQLGKIVGAKVIAIAGSEEKCQWLERELGVDKALNYKSPTFVEEFKDSVGYLDVYFDNVGGEILDLCLTRLKKYARVALCGAISAYNEEKPRGLQGYLNLISQAAKIQGFVITNYGPRYDEGRQKLAEWLAEGKLKRRFYIQDGLEKAPEYLQELFAGRNTGKMVINVSKQPVPKL